jgi:protein XRP2
MLQHVQVHGFLAARGDWEKPEVLAGANKAIGILAKFLKANI